jgi:segregation and condensation protein B
MTDHPDEDRIPAWMTLPGSLASQAPTDLDEAGDAPKAPEPAAHDGAGPDGAEADTPAPDAAGPGADLSGADGTEDTDAADGARDTGNAAGAGSVGEASPVSAVSQPVAFPGAGAVSAGAVEPGASGEGEVEGPGLKAALEAIMLVVDEPVAEVTLAQVLERPTHEVAAALRELSEEYTAAARGFDLRQVAGGWRYYTRADCAQLVERFVRDGQQTRLTQAALETLAVVAYRQPVSRARVAAVRGVNSDGVIRTLVARGLVEEAGSDPESQAVLYRTSSYFLERLGLKDLSELPELAPFLPDDVENLEETTK